MSSERARQASTLLMDGVSRDRTFTRQQLRTLIGADAEFLKQLADHYGLIPLGRSGSLYWGGNLMKALFNHAEDKRVPPRRKAIKAADLRSLNGKKGRKSKGAYRRHSATWRAKRKYPPQFEGGLSARRAAR